MQLTPNTVLIVLFLVIGFTPLLNGQSGNLIWYFGQHAGLDFNTNPPQSISGQLNSNEGCATMCDQSGQLLFYTNGKHIWDRNHQLMPGSMDLAGGLSSTQAALIVPVPTSCSRYYLFYMEDHNEDGDFYYSIVDMNLRNGMGDIEAISKNILITNRMCEKAIAIPHQNGKDSWILTHKYGSDQFLAYLFTKDGLSMTPVISGIGAYYNNAAVIGPVKASPDGRKIVSSASFHSICDLFDFDDASGILTNHINLIPLLGNSRFVYGIEFSPDNTLLYLASFWVTSTLNQIELSNMTLLTLQSIPGNYIYGALQTGPDGKIYVARENQNYLGVIHAPNLPGLNCNYQEVGQMLAASTFSGSGLPNVTHPALMNDHLLSFSLGQDTVLCEGDSLNLIPDVPGHLLSMYLWEDGSTDSLKTINHEGTYWVEVTNQCGHSTDTVNISTIIPPQIYLTDTTLCEGQNIVLDATYEDASYLWSDQSTSPYLSIDQPGIYAVTVTNGCGSASSAAEISFSNPPHIHLRDTTLCEGNGLLIDVTQEGASYLWSDQSTSSYLSIDHPGIYAVTLTNGCGSASSAAEISFSSSPHIHLSDTTLCEGNGLLIDITQEGASYLWSDQSTSPIFHIEEAGVYAVTITDLCGTYSDSMELTLIAPPLIKILDTAICEGEYILLEVPLENVSYEWPNGATEAFIITSEAGSYAVTLTNSCGISTVTFNVENMDCSVKLYIPNVFTPNADGINDHIRAFATDHPVEYRFKIFDRWGNHVFETSSYEEVWDGFYKGKSAPPGVYAYTLHALFANGGQEVLKGNITLIR